MTQLIGFLAQLAPEPWLIALIASLGVGVLLYELVLSRSLTSSEMARRFRKVTSAAEEEEAFHPPERRSIEGRLLAAGIDLGANARLKFYMISAGLGAAVLAFVSLFGVSLPIALMAGAASSFLPRWYIGEKARKRVEKMEEELPSAYARIAAVIKTQPDPTEALYIVAQGLERARPGSPLASELERTALDGRAKGIKQALDELRGRTESPSLANFADSLAIYAEAGGEYAETLTASAQRMREILTARAEGRAKAGDAMMAARLLPLILAGVTLFFMQDPEFTRFYHSLVGQLFLAGVALMMAVGYRFMQNKIKSIG